MPVADQKAETAEYWFKKQIIDRHSCPRELLSDQETHFTSKIFQELMKEFGVERFNRALLQTLSCYIQKMGDCWDQYVDHALGACRVTIQETMQESPFRVVYGRDPVDLLMTRIEEITEATQQNMCEKRPKRCDMRGTRPRKRLA